MKRCKPLLGTYVEIAAEISNKPNSSAEMAAITEAFRRIDIVQSLMSVFCSDSDITRINAGAHLNPIKVHPWTWELLRLSLELHNDSGGAFDISTGKWLHAMGHRQALAQQFSEATGGMPDLDLLDDCHVFARQPIALDLGGIAKGFAIDRAVEILVELGCTRGSVNAGGDLRVFGETSHPIHLRHSSPPHTPVFLGSLADGAMATSANYFAIEASTKAKGHLIDPRTGSTMESSGSFCVLAPTAVLADALTKVIAISGITHHDALVKHQATALTLQ